ncbi:ZIP zinc transporter-domain-containing protein [Xylariaceae sp. FL1272]|nr:ZIP zinc transporter-domain-containing protein [Xylariaceae sp. FL1272]
MAGAGLFLLLALTAVMALASFLAGALPLSMSLTAAQLRLISSIGVGILVGTSLIVIIPEGIEAVVEASTTTRHPDTIGDKAAVRWAAGAELPRDQLAWNKNTQKYEPISFDEALGFVSRSGLEWNKDTQNYELIAPELVSRHEPLAWNKDTQRYEPITLKEALELGSRSEERGLGDGVIARIPKNTFHPHLGWNEDTEKYEPISFEEALNLASRTEKQGSDEGLHARTPKNTFRPVSWNEDTQKYEPISLKEALDLVSRMEKRAAVDVIHPRTPKNTFRPVNWNEATHKYEPISLEQALKLVSRYKQLTRYEEAQKYSHVALEEALEPVSESGKRKDELRDRLGWNKDTQKYEPISWEEAMKLGPGTEQAEAFDVLRTRNAEDDPKAPGDANPPAKGGETEFHTFYIGLSLILGFILMFLVDRLPRHASENLQAPPPPRHISLSNLGASSLSGDEEESEGFLGSLAPTPKQSRSLATTTGLVIHAAADGIAMGASVSSPDKNLGLIVFIAIMVHKAPAAFGLTSILLKQGLSKRAARGHLIVFSLASPFGAWLTFILVSFLGGGAQGQFSQWWTGMLLLFSAGTFLYVAMHAMQDTESASGHDIGSGVNGYAETNGIRKHGHPQLRETLATMIGMLLPLLTQFGHHH